ncbi:MAG: hypothetical protein ARM1_0070 [Candidatus Micrarchaeota archaeon]|nr:MAG: hypothetical protein ARM1_0070 [Candidatus Micrarchaeota archaeon]
MSSIQRSDSKDNEATKDFSKLLNDIFLDIIIKNNIPFVLTDENHNIKNTIPLDILGEEEKRKLKEIAEKMFKGDSKKLEIVEKNIDKVNILLLKAAEREGKNKAFNIKLVAAARLLFNLLDDISKKVKEGSKEINLYEASSGNFAISLAYLLHEINNELKRRGIDVKIKLNIVISRSLPEGVKKALNEYNDSLNVIEINNDQLCPAPGLNQNAANGNISGIEYAKNLAKIKNGIYIGQYENPSAVEAHKLVTAYSIEQGLKKHNLDSAKFAVITTFGTGATALGLVKGLENNESFSKLYVVFPENDQDVAGIRSKASVKGLSFYEQISDEAYRSKVDEVEVDAFKNGLLFEVVEKLGVGESTTLNIIALLNILANENIEAKNFVIIQHDTASKYADFIKSLKSFVKNESKDNKLDLFLIHSNKVITNRTKAALMYISRELEVKINLIEFDPEKEDIKAIKKASYAVVMCAKGIRSSTIAMRLTKEGVKAKAYNAYGELVFNPDDKEELESLMR